MIAYGLGIDIGTSSAKVSLLSPLGEVVSSAEYSYETFSPHPGWMEQDPRSWITAVTYCIGSLVKEHPKEAKEIGGIGLTSAAHIGVLMDASLRPVRNALLWSDQRAVAQTQKLIQDDDIIYAVSANRPSPSWTLPHFLWVKEEEPEIWKEVHYIGLSKDYVAHWLTGVWTTDPATAVSSQFADKNTFTWSDILLEYVGLRADQFPTIRAATEVIGVIQKKLAHSLGLPETVTIVNGTLDSATETYGAGGRKAGDLIIRIGTAGGIHLITEEPLQNRKLLTYPFPVGGVWYSQAGTNAAGSALKWATQLAGFTPNKEGFNRLAKRAEGIAPGSDGVVFHPYLNGERTPYWDANLRGTFSGLSFVHGPEHMSRAVYEGVCYSLLDALSAMMDPNLMQEEIVVVGGGTKDPLLMEILSSLLNRKLRLALNADSSYGAGRIAQLSLYSPERLAMIDGMNYTVVTPKTTWVDRYAEGFETYKRVSGTLLRMYRGEE